MLNRERVKLADQHRGIKDMRRLPDAVIVVDAQYEDTAVREAKRLFIPVIAIVDSNTDPSKVDYPIPANDDSIRTIQLIISALAEAINEARGAVAEKSKKKSDKKKDIGANDKPVTEKIEDIVVDAAENSEKTPDSIKSPDIKDSENASKDTIEESD
jgi:ribosomal protein S2